MTENTAEMIIDLRDEIPDIRPFPQTATQVMAACDSPNTTPQELCEIIQCDPGIAMKIVRVANSSAYGLSGEVRTLQSAVVVLGFSSLRSLAVSAAAQDVFSSSASAKKDRDEIWQHSIGCAAVAGMLASQVKSVTSEEAFLAAIVHDVGKLVLIDAAPEHYRSKTIGCSAETICDVEQSLFGVDHQSLGMQCAEEWGLPYDIADAIGMHHHVFGDNDNPDLVNLIGLSDGLSQHWGLGSREVEVDLESLLRFTNLGFELEAVELLKDDAHQQFEALQNAFSG